MTEFRKKTVKNINDNYYIEEKCYGLIKHSMRKSDNENIAVLDRFTTEIMGYGPYRGILETVTCNFKKSEMYVLEYFFGEYFKNLPD